MKAFDWKCIFALLECIEFFSLLSDENTFESQTDKLATINLWNDAIYAIS